MIKNNKTLLGKYSSRAIRLVQEAPVIDMLGMFHLSNIKRDGENITRLWLRKPGSFTDADFQKFKRSGINVFAFGELCQDYHAMVESLAVWNGFIASNSQYFERIDTSEKLSGINKSDKIGILLSYQDSTHFQKVNDVDTFYGLGQRVSQLTYNGKNQIGCGCFEDCDTGLTDFGASIIERMNHIGMIVDISHCGDQTTLDAIAASKKPLLITHAPCRALITGYARSKSDEAIIKVTSKGGVIGIPMLRFMIRDREPVTIEHVLDHIDHVAKIAGVEHVGIGSDQSLDTEDSDPLEVRKKTLMNAPAKYNVRITKKYQISIDGLNHPHRSFDLTEGLIRRKYSDENIRLILGGNFLRVLKDFF